MTSSFLADDNRSVLSLSLAALRRQQRDDGHWLFELEADASITAEYMLLEHFMGRVTPDRQAAMARHLRRKATAAQGGWPLFEGGDFNLSVSVKAYFALKFAGDAVDSPHMSRARQAILAAGGVAQANVFTRIQLALFGILPWHAIPSMPVELILLPARAPFSIWAVSYWSRTCIVPLLVIQSLKPTPRGQIADGLRELFVQDVAAGPRRSTSRRSWRDHSFDAVDWLLKVTERLRLPWLRDKAIATARSYVEERLNGEDGLGAIYPAMAYSLLMFHALGHRGDDPVITKIWSALDRLVVNSHDESYCQPCLSPVWDTAFAGHALLQAFEAGIDGASREDVEAACDWLVERQITEVRGDWSIAAPDVESGGWAFQYRNDHFPDVDDTSIVALLLLRLGRPTDLPAIDRARCWILGMQSAGGGWGAFDVNNDRNYLNGIPFADHGALLDPPTVDVTARCVSFLARLGHDDDRAAIERATTFLLREQKDDGSWFGRWGTNHIYGTWSVLSALADAGLAQHPAVLRATRWLESVQGVEGGWGEDERSYDKGHYVASARAHASQTAWAVLALTSVGRGYSASAEKGRAWLRAACSADGTWHEVRNGVGFPRVFYLFYKGYSLYFPILALTAEQPIPDHRSFIL